MLLDLYLPLLNGHDLLIRMHEMGISVDVIFTMSGYADTNDAQECLRLGATDHLLKPIDLDHLHRSILLRVATRPVGRRKPLPCQEADSGLTRARGRVRVDAFLFEHVEAGDPPRAVNGLDGHAGTVLIDTLVDMTPMTDRSGDVPARLGRKAGAAA